jgi:hypothetical protein
LLAGQLPLPEQVEGVGPIPEDITGLERRYLEALRSNVKTREDYNHLLEHEATDQSRAVHNEDDGTHLLDYVEFLRLRRRIQELRILQQYLNKLQNTEALKPGFLDLKRIQKHDALYIPPPCERQDGTISQEEESVDAQVRRLEIAVIRAKHQADLERRLLEEVKSELDSAPQKVKQCNRTRALAAARDELVAWMENKLSTQPTDGKLDDQMPDEEQDLSSLQHLQSDTMQHYHRYIEARQKTLALVSKINTFSTQQSACKDPASTRDALPPPPTPIPSLSPYLLPFIKTHFQNPTQAHKFHTLHSTHLNNLLNIEQTKTNTELSRLADESHLLLAYPILAQQERFKHISSALGPKGSQESLTSRQQDGIGGEMGRRVNAWKFAADAAGEALGDFVKDRLGKGGQALDEGDGWILELRELLGEDGAEKGLVSAEEEPEEEEEDVWAMEAGAGGRKANRRSKRPDSKGPWAGLRGDIGLNKDG